ncbi:hypothetical protein BDF14DRAFT_1836907 [Spinellus fusiger]|nr:hypothetical protein BDF14DRAFT_1836907 [Spinellus fusiger]
MDDSTSDCNINTYCSLDSNICLPRFLINSPCLSTHQCYVGHVCASLYSLYYCNCHKHYSLSRVGGDNCIETL